MRPPFRLASLVWCAHLGYAGAASGRAEEANLADGNDIVHHVGCGTHIGRRHRKNQDSGGAWSWFSDGGVPVSLAIVADGVSSGANSEWASRLAVERLHRAVAEDRTAEHSTPDALLAALIEAATVASREIARHAQVAGTGVHAADATTLAAVACAGREAVGLWCGDSRVYCLSHRGVTALTSDHSWIQRVVSAGLMSEEEAGRDPRARMITRWLGPQDGSGPEIDTFRLRLEDDDIVLCCSDGLYLYFIPPEGRNDEMRHTLVAGRGELQARLDRLAALALDRGGHDDITLAAIQVTAT